jgi:serine/threonine protein phosphatase 1
VEMVYAVGDIHGRLDLLQAMDRRIQQDIATCGFQKPVICYLGDYIDRGPDSAGVLNYLACGESDGPVRIYLKGNHEDRMLDFLESPQEHGSGWLKYGGRETFESYRIVVPEKPMDADWVSLRDALADALPRGHLHFLRHLNIAYRWRDHLFVHAGLNPDRALEDQLPHDLMWIREPFLSSERQWGPRVVHGHVIESSPVVKPNRIGIDTGAYQSGRLTCLVAETTPRFLSITSL